ncbi:13262_t:CDS:2 [Entrophospora sp. SA101]|nr:13262_t:CDS:2 [Entrophospora sp. SA101]
MEQKLPLSISSLLATTTNHNNNTIITANPGTTTASLPTLIKFYKNLYDPIYNTRSESSDWLNVLLAQIICQYRDDAKTDNSLIRYVDGILNGGEKPSFLGSIKVTRLDLGEDFPVFRIDTQILINWPKPKIAVLPISLVLSVIKFEATSIIYR